MPKSANLIAPYADLDVVKDILLKFMTHRLTVSEALAAVDEVYESTARVYGLRIGDRQLELMERQMVTTAHHAKQQHDDLQELIKVMKGRKS